MKGISSCSRKRKWEMKKDNRPQHYLDFTDKESFNIQLQS